MKMRIPQIVIDEVWHSGGGSSCSQCERPAAKSLCVVHLRMARNHFRRWTAIRKARCQCVRCDSLAPIVVTAAGETRQGVYCPHHRRINAERCKAWMASNRKRLKKRYRDRVKAGVCTRSEKHGKALDGHVVCARCFARQKKLKTIYERR